MVGYLQLAEVREIVEVTDFFVAGHQAAAGDVGEGGGDVGKGGEAVHPRGTHLDKRSSFWRGKKCVSPLPEALPLCSLSCQSVQEKKGQETPPPSPWTSPPSRPSCWQRRANECVGELAGVLGAGDFTHNNMNRKSHNFGLSNVEAKSGLNLQPQQG